jgi:hypothetical protein
MWATSPGRRPVNNNTCNAIPANPALLKARQNSGPRKENPYPAILSQLRQTPSAMALLNDPASKGWKSIAYENQSDKAWIFLAKAEPEWTDGAYSSELFRRERFRWLRRSANLEIPPGTECVGFRIFGTGRPDPSQTVRVTGNNIRPIQLNIAGTNLANQLDVRIPIPNPSQGDHLNLQADMTEITPTGDARTVALGATVPKRKSHSDGQ